MCTSGWDFGLHPFFVHTELLLTSAGLPANASHVSPLQSLPLVASAVEHSKPRYTDAASVKLLIFANGVVLFKVWKIISYLWGGGKQSIYIYICIYIIWLHMYMMNFINLSVCLITFDDVAVGCSKVSVFWKPEILYTQVAFRLSCCFKAIVLAVVRRLNDTTAKFLFIPFCNYDVNYHGICVTAILKNSTVSRVKICLGVYWTLLREKVPISHTSVGLQSAFLLFHFLNFPC